MKNIKSLRKYRIIAQVKHLMYNWINAVTFFTYARISKSSHKQLNSEIERTEANY